MEIGVLVLRCLVKLLCFRMCVMVYFVVRLMMFL